MASTGMSYGTALGGIPIHQYPTNITSEVERTLRTIFKRCVQCPDESPTCPPCSNSEICSLVPTDCNTCAHMVCVRNPSSSTSSSGPNVGAIAGGVVGGVAFVGLVVFLLWYLWIRKKRAQQEAEAEEWEEDDIAQQKSMHQSHFQAMQQDAASTRTRGSFANSILSRASNIIQIAYIPGVTNRNGSGHNSLMGNSPVPPIPAARRDMPRSPLANDDGALFFRPGDLRDSTWSASSAGGDKRDTQYSLTPSLARSSVASGIYRDDGSEMPMPAQQIVRAAPRMVSVKSGSSHSPGETPGSQTPVSSSDHSEFAANTPGGKGKGIQVMMPGERPNTSGSLQSSGSMKARQIDIGSKKGRFPVRQPSDSSTLTVGKHQPAVSSPLAGGDDSDDDEDEHARARQSLVNTSKEVSSPPALQPVESPFFDASEKPSSSAQAATSSTQRPNPYKSMAATVGTGLDDRPKRGGKGMGGLSAVIEEATKRASRVPSHDGLGGKRDQSPFDDAHEVE